MSVVAVDDLHATLSFSRADVDQMSVTFQPRLVSGPDEVVEVGEYDSRSEATRDGKWSA